MISVKVKREGKTQTPVMSRRSQLLTAMFRCSRLKQVIFCAVLVLLTLLVVQQYTSRPATRPLAAPEPRKLHNIAHPSVRGRPGIRGNVLKTTQIGRTGSVSTTKLVPDKSTTTVLSTTPRKTTEKVKSTTVRAKTTSATTVRVTTTTSAPVTSSPTRKPGTTVSPSVLKARNKMIENFRKMEIKESDKLIMKDLLDALWGVRKQHNLTGMFLYGGTLLGSWRHHGFVPYDDDVDIASPKELYYPLLNALNKIGPDYICVKAGWRLKFFSKHSTHKTPYSWKWPYIDLQFYEQDDDNIWDAASEFKGWKYPKKYTFPLRRRPYEGKWYDTPKNPDKFLEVYYPDLDSCETGWYSHMREAGQRIFKIRCKYLEGVYPFVTERKKVGGKDVEMLTKNGEVIREVTLPS